MAITFKLKRRASGAAGAPAALLSGEPAHNEVDNTLYIGVGDNGAGEATSVAAVGGAGAFVALTGAQTVAGAKTFSTVPKASQDAAGSTDLVRKGQMDTALAGKANTSHSHAIDDVTDLQSTLDGKAAAAHDHAIGDVTGLQASLDGKAALASPTFTGTPTAPTPPAANNSTRIATTAYVQGELSAFGAGDMAKSVYDQNDSGKVDHAELADAVPWAGISGKPSTFPPAAHSHAVGDVTGLQGALDARAPLASPELTGNPTAPTQDIANASTRIATTAFVKAAIDALIGDAPGALDTLAELAAALGEDPDFATTITTSIANKARKDANLADLTDAAAARTNLGLGSMAQQAANTVAITGGSIEGVTLDGGTF